MYGNVASLTLGALWNWTIRFCGMYNLADPLPISTKNLKADSRLIQKQIILINQFFLVNQNTWLSQIHDSYEPVIFCVYLKHTSVHQVKSLEKKLIGLLHS